MNNHRVTFVDFCNLYKVPRSSHNFKVEYFRIFDRSKKKNL